MDRDTVLYFSHDMNAASDKKIVKLRMKYDWAGYGIYWAIVEKLRSEKDFRLECDYDLLAYDLRFDQEKLKDIIENFELFKIENGYFFSESLNRRMELKKEKSKKASESASKRWHSEDDANTMRTQCEGDASAMQLKESKLNKNKFNKNIPREIPISPANWENQVFRQCCGLIGNENRSMSENHRRIIAKIRGDVRLGLDNLRDACKILGQTTEFKYQNCKDINWILSDFNEKYLERIQQLNSLVPVVHRPPPKPKPVDVDICDNPEEYLNEISEKLK